MQDVYIGVTAVYKTAELREKCAELENLKGVRIKEDKTFVPYLVQGDILVLPEPLQGTKPTYYTTSVQVTKPWIGVIPVSPSGIVLNPLFRNNERGRMGFSFKGAVTLYMVTTKGYAEIEYVSAHPEKEGMKLNRHRLLGVENLPFQVGAPSGLLKKAIIHALEDEASPDEAAQTADRFLEAFAQGQERMKCYREAESRQGPRETTMQKSFRKAVEESTRKAQEKSADKRRDSKESGGKKTGGKSSRQKRKEEIQKEEAQQEEAQEA